jgi:hypothetical protein
MGELEFPDNKCHLGEVSRRSITNVPAFNEESKVWRVREAAPPGRVRKEELRYRPFLVDRAVVASIHKQVAVSVSATSDVLRNGLDRLIVSRSAHIGETCVHARKSSMIRVVNLLSASREGTGVTLTEGVAA